MKFSHVFNRWKGAAQPTNVPILLGGDSVPTTPGQNRPNKSTMDNLVTSRFRDTNGWPCHRIAVLYKPPSGTTALDADMYMYEDTLDTWFRVNGVAGSGNILANAVTFFDCVGLLDLPVTSNNLNAKSQSFDVG